MCVVEAQDAACSMNIAFLTPGNGEMKLKCGRSNAICMQSAASVLRHSATHSCL